MSHPPHLRAKARQLRARLMTIDEIAARLALPRTTIFHWVRDLPIPATARQTEAQRRGTLAMQARALERREAAYRRGADEYAELCADPTFRDFVCLYLAEGSKRSRGEVQICNSDPAVVRLADRWIRTFAGRAPAYQLQYHVDQDLDVLRAFWGALLRVDPSGIAVQRKSTAVGSPGATGAPSTGCSASASGIPRSVPAWRPGWTDSEPAGTRLGRATGRGAAW